MITEKRRSILIVAILFLCLAALIAVMAANAKRSDSVIDRLYDAATLSDVQPAKIPQSEEDFILAELKRRAADDCVLTPTSYGWRCREHKTGRVFKIARQ